MLMDVCCIKLYKAFFFILLWNKKSLSSSSLSGDTDSGPITTDGCNIYPDELDTYIWLSVIGIWQLSDCKKIN